MAQRTKAGQGVPTSVAQGLVAGFQSTVQVTPGRLDFVVSPVPVEDAEDERPIAPVTTMLEFALGISDASELDLGEVSRLSIIAVLDIPSTGRAESNETFKALSGVTLPDSVSDLVFQFSNPANDRLPYDAGLNRVTRISVLAQRVMLIKVDMAISDLVPERVPLGSDQWSTLIQLDFNTIPEGKTYGRDEQNALLDAIAQEIISIAQGESLVSVLS